MRPRPQSLLIIAAIIFAASACSLPDRASPHRLAEELSADGWSDVSGGSAGYEIEWSGIVRHAEGIRATRVTAIGKLSFALGRFEAHLSWLDLIKGGQPGKITITGAGLIFEPPDGYPILPDFSWPEWPGSTLRILGSALAGREHSGTDRRIILELDGQIGSSLRSTDIAIHWNGSSGSIRFLRGKDELTWNFHEQSDLIYSIEPDVGGLIGPLKIGPGEVSLAGPADLSLLLSFVVPGWILKLGPGTGYSETNGIQALVLKNVDIAGENGPGLHGSLEMKRTSQTASFELSLGVYPVRWEMAEGRLSKFIMNGSRSTLAWPAEAGATASIELDEFLDLKWGGQPVDLSEFRFSGLKLKDGETFGFLGPLLGRSASFMNFGGEYVLKLDGFTLSGPGNAIPLFYRFRKTIADLELRSNSHTRSMSIEADFRNVSRPMVEFISPELTAANLFRIKPDRKTLLDAEVKNVRTELRISDGRLLREIELDADGLVIRPLTDGRMGIWIRPDRNPGPPDGEIIVRGSLFDPRIDFVDSGSREKILKRLSSELQ